MESPRTGYFTDTALQVRASGIMRCSLLGYNYRMTDIQAALGYSQLTKIKRFIEARREIAAYYNHAFQDNPYFDIPIERDYGQSSYHLYTIQIKRTSCRQTSLRFRKTEGRAQAPQVMASGIMRCSYWVITIG